MLEFDGFDWDHGNLEKCTRHGLSLSEIDGLTYIRPISARPMHAKEIARYER
jgi:uncharacterized DUF497 family protein